MEALNPPDRRTGPTRALVWVTVACLSVLAVYVAATGTRRLGYLPWNLFLAWVPYVLGRAIHRLAERTQHGTGVLILPVGLWLLFFPNAPYIVTDLVHLTESPGRYVLVDGVLIVAFAGLGLALAITSLGAVHGVVRDRLGQSVGWAFVAAAGLLTGVGVWLGRVLRWNSWDLFTDPVGLLGTLGRGLASPTAYIRPLAFSAAFGGALLLLYLGARMLSPARRR
jgi:uncharacterized membrane protein